MKLSLAEEIVQKGERHKKYFILMMGFRWGESSAFILFILLLSLSFSKAQFPPSNGFKQLGDSCTESPECNRILWLECVNGVCNCTAPGDTQYDPRFRRCFGRLGSSCFQYGIGPYCQPGLFCNLNGNPVRESVETRSLFPFRGVCVESLTLPVPRPRPPPVPQPPPVTISGLGGPCGLTPAGALRCGDGMACIQGKCQCNAESGQFYVPDEPFCRIGPGGPCNPNWKAQCRGDNECVPGKDEGTFFCQCIGGTSLDPDNQCRPNYLSACSIGSKDPPCRVGKFLDCLDGSCVCSNPIHQIWSKEGDICVTQSGSVCNPQLPPCTEFSDCVAGRCLCRDGYYETSLRTCKLRLVYGYECKSGECDETRGMVCRRGQCVCVDPLMLFDERKLACLALPGDICGQLQFDGIPKPVSIPCPDGFICKETAPGAFRCTLP